MLKINHLSVSFKNVDVLKNLSGTIENGDFITIIGANGAGKSTLLDAIAGKIKPKTGSLILDEIDITGKNERERAPFMGRLFQNPSLSSVPSMTVRENLALATFKHGVTGFSKALKNFPVNAVKNILEPMNINIVQLLDKRMGDLSGGQRQLIAFVMATLTPPKLLLLDEPTAALDPGSATRLLMFATHYIRQHSITTIMITHDPHLATTLGNKLWIIEDGIIKKEYGPEKKNLSTEDLIGEIDYAQLAA